MRLIDADTLKLYIDKEVEEDKVIDGWAFFFKIYLDNAPSIDIVRCKECKHRYTADCFRAYLEYDIQEWVVDSGDDDDYCSWGEREASYE